MVGQTISHYEVLEKIGAGGMGVVYKARDTRLERFIALKVLPPERVADPARTSRFIQEAKAASALNHPNIITIHDIDESHGVHFIAMEYVAGKTLDALIPRKGLRLGETLKYAVQIADALAKAHAKGIIHRDLKPTNIMVTDDGLVKVLDFGLAKLTEPEEIGDSAPTRTVKPQTEEGTIVGTAAYMSPEQAEGRKVTPRSDIFAFGSVLYEMLTGRRAFEGETRLSTLSSILREEPKPLRELAGDVPRELERILQFCLKKDPDRRIQHMEDLKIQLEALKEESDSGKLEAAPAALRPRPRRPRWRIAALAVAVIALGASVTWKLRTPAPAAQKYSFTQLTDQPGPEVFPSLSPDGKSFVYAGHASGNWDIYLQRVGGKNAINLTKDSPAEDRQPAFSPDGDRIAFRSEREGGGIFLMGAMGESVKRLTDFGFNPAWSPDGRRIVVATEGVGTWNPQSRWTVSQLWIVDAATGEKRLLSQGDGVQPSWSPHGRRVAYWTRGAILTVRADAAPSEKPVVAVTWNQGAWEWNPVWSPDGSYLYFASDRGGSMNLWRVSIDEQSGKALGEPDPITTPSPYAGHFSLSRDGRRLAYSHQVQFRNIQSIGFDPAGEKVVGPPVSITRGTRMATCPDVSPDGKWLVFHTYGHPEDLFVIGTNGTGLRQLSDDPYSDREPRWSPDGKRVAFWSNRSGNQEVWMMRADGSGLQQFTYKPGASFPVWSPDGARLAFSDRDASYLADVDKPWKEQSLKTLPPGFQAWWWSPDGRRIAGRRSGGIDNGFGVYRLDTASVDWLSSTGTNPVWLSDSRRLLFLDGDVLKLVDSQSRKEHEVLSAAPDSVGNYSITRDDRRIYYGVLSGEADIWLMSLE